MLLLTGTSELIKLVTGSAADVDVHASYVDNASGVITPGKLDVEGIGQATTTVVGSPGSSTQRNVKHLNIFNRHATVSTLATVQHFDGTLTIDMATVTLLPGEGLVFDQNGTWSHRDSQGGLYTYAGPPTSNLGITGTLAETMPRETCPEVNSTVPTASGTLFMQAIYLKAGQLVSNITVASATTAANTPTNGRAGLFDANRNLLATSADQLTTAWAANTVKTLPMTTPYRVPTSGVYYIGFYMVATAVITMKGGTARTGGQLAGTAPIIAGTSTTGLTTTLPNPGAAITASLASMYAAVS